jgi:hypothetical protein
MMIRKLLPFASLFVFAIGCGQSSSQPVAGQAGGPVQVANIPGAPDQTVQTFLEAVRTGNDAQASAMMSPVARQKIAEKNLVVAPPGTATAKFSVGKFEYVTPEKDGAHVWSTWTDVADDQGHTRSDNIIWVLRGESEGWRIVGMVTKVYPDQPPLVLNFEDPDDMTRKMQLLDAAEHGQASGDQQGVAQPQATRPMGDQPVQR